VNEAEFNTRLADAFRNAQLLAQKYLDEHCFLALEWDLANEWMCAAYVKGEQLLIGHPRVHALGAIESFRVTLLQRVEAVKLDRQIRKNMRRDL
jgi:hypothetical protein